MTSETPLRRCLIIVDMSVEQVADVSYKTKQVVQNCRRLASDLDFFHLVVDSRLWLASPNESSLSWVFPESGRTLFVKNSKGASLIPQLSDLDHLSFVAKNNYSCFCRSKLLETLQREDIKQVYICGINTDYCVFATALDSFSHKFETFVLEDAVTSVRGKHAHEEGIRNLQRHFGPSIIVKTDDLIEKSS